MAPVVGVLAGLGAAGLLLLTAAWTSGPPRPFWPTRETPRWGQLAADGSLAVVVGAIVLAVTGWIVAGIAGALGAVATARAWRRRPASGSSEQERIEALATWCEQLRDLLAADQGIVGTISATARTCPAPLREHVAALSARLARQEAATAIAQFADDVDDPSGDLVATVLLEATRRSSHTAELLSELAVTTRERAAMRLRVEAERSGQRAEARFVVAFSAAVIGGVCVFGRDSEFLDAFDDGPGQLVLVIVAACFGGGIRWLGRLTRFERPARFLSLGAQGGSDSSGVVHATAGDGG